MKAQKERKTQPSDEEFASGIAVCPVTNMLGSQDPLDVIDLGEPAVKAIDYISQSLVGHPTGQGRLSPAIMRYTDKDTVPILFRAGQRKSWGESLLMTAEERDKVNELTEGLKLFGCLALCPERDLPHYVARQGPSQIELLRELIDSWYHFTNRELEEHIVSLAKARELEPPTMSNFLDAMGEALRQADSDPDSGCKKCGACCLFLGTPPYRREELASLPKNIREIVKWFHGNNHYRGVERTPCYFFNLSTRSCLVHGQYKPRICREFKPGCSYCEDSKQMLLPALDSLNQSLHDCTRKDGEPAYDCARR